MLALGAHEVVDSGDTAPLRARAADGVIDAARLRERVLPVVRDGGKYIGLRAGDQAAERGITGENGSTSTTTLRSRILDFCTQVRYRRRESNER
ncbi:MDR/zinc-dependent alcohol dehydrogenase-like family protein [Actinomadura physcomitrii]|uniref:hypothetical protein n=1 Tax=Actinomadura physcomitrii TaxID=2650748 RepID=UPI0038B2957D